MDWKEAESMLTEMSVIFNRDNIRKLTYNREVFPLAFRYENGERSDQLYQSIISLYRELIYHY